MATHSPSADELYRLLDRVRTWPAERREDALRTLRALESEGDKHYELTKLERADLDRALEEIARGEVASDQEVAATFARYR